MNMTTLCLDLGFFFLHQNKIIMNIIFRWLEHSLPISSLLILILWSLKLAYCLSQLWLLSSMRSSYPFCRFALWSGKGVWHNSHFLDLETLISFPGSHTTKPGESRTSGLLALSITTSPLPKCLALGNHRQIAVGIPMCTNLSEKYHRASFSFQKLML